MSPTWTTYSCPTFIFAQEMLTFNFIFTSNNSWRQVYIVFSFLFFTFFSLLNVYLQLERLRWWQTGHHYYHTPSPTQSLSTSMLLVSPQPQHSHLFTVASFDSTQDHPWHPGIVASFFCPRMSLGILSLIVFYLVSSTHPSGPADIMGRRIPQKRAQTMQNMSFGPVVSFFIFISCFILLMTVFRYY